MSGTVLITGANGSLALGFIQSLLASRTPQVLVATVRNTSAKEDPNTAKLMRLFSKYPKAKTVVESLDLGKLASVRSFSEKLAGQISSGKLPPISAIICNAATLSLDAGQKFTTDGYETTFQVCHLSHYLMILKLLGSMDMTSGRIVMLGSITHYPEKPNPLTAFRPEIPSNIENLVKPLPDSPGEAHDRGYQRYATAKLANVTFMNDLNRRLEADPKLSKVTATAMDPGGLPSSRAQAEQRLPVRMLMAVINFLMPVLKHLTTTFRTTEDAGRDLVAISVEPDFAGKRGYFVGPKSDIPAEVTMDVRQQKRLFEACWTWAGLTREETILQDTVS